jgi:hypothetical protein
MRIHAIACAAVFIAGAGCSGELVQRPTASDPTSVAAAEAPFTPTPAYQPDPLLSPIPPRSPEPPPTGTEQIHSPTAVPPGNPPMREEPGAHTPPRHDRSQQREPDAPYRCPMHPEVRSPTPGQCPKCGMTLVPKAGGQ